MLNENHLNLNEVLFLSYVAIIFFINFSKILVLKKPNKTSNSAKS